MNKLLSMIKYQKLRKHILGLNKIRFELIWVKLGFGSVWIWLIPFRFQLFEYESISVWFDLCHCRFESTLDQ